MSEWMSYPFGLIEGTGVQTVINMYWEARPFKLKLLYTGWIVVSKLCWLTKMSQSVGLILVACRVGSIVSQTKCI